MHWNNDALYFKENQHDHIFFVLCVGNLVVSQLMDEFLLDFDLFHVREPTELLRHIDIKFLPVDFGGHVSVDPGSWILLQVLYCISTTLLEATKLRTQNLQGILCWQGNVVRIESPRY